MAVKRYKSVKKNNRRSVNADNEEGMIKGFETAPTSLLQAFDRVGMVAKHNEFTDEGLSAVDAELEYLSKRLGVTRMQAKWRVHW